MLSLFEEFKSFIQQEELFPKNSPVLLAVSGGIDSVVMVSLFHKAGFPIGIAHANFKLRRKASDEDEKFVKELAEKYAIPYYIKEFHTQQVAEKEGISIQMAARQLRYEWLEEVRKKEKYSYLATAHHADDQVETVLLNLAKGTGISGLRGIFSKKGTLVRPILFADKGIMETYAKENKLNFREDISNRDLKYERNRIRHKVIPQLKEINPSLTSTFLQNTDHFRDAEKLYNDAVEKRKKELSEIKGDEVFIPVRKLKKMPAPKTLLYEILKEYGFNPDQAGMIFNNLDAQPGKVFYSEHYRLVKDRKFLILSPVDSDKITHLYIREDQKNVKTEDLHLRHKVKEKGKIAASENVASLDLDKLKFPLLLRKWKKGDYFYPFGLKKRSGKPAKKKVSDFLVDQKVPLTEKDKIMVLLSGKKIAWIVGYRIDERFKITPGTKKIFILEKI